jgi:HD-like signal output (HDOD) protein
MSLIQNEEDPLLAKTLELMKSVEIPSCPRIVMQVNEEMKNPNVNLMPLAVIISKDVGLSARLLKIANSALFGSRSPVDSLDQALTRLGIRNFRNAVMAGCLRQALGEHSGVMDRFWAHSETVAMLSQKIAYALCPTTAEAAYTVGLFHDCGIPIMLKKFPGYQAHVKGALGFEADVVAAEEAAYETHHGAVGALLCRTWNLPTASCRAIRDHHLAQATDNLLWAVVQLAERVELKANQRDKPLFAPDESHVFECILKTLSVSPESVQELAIDLIDLLKPEDN